jgi:hypothetical protein
MKLQQSPSDNAAWTGCFYILWKLLSPWSRNGGTMWMLTVILVGQHGIRYPRLEQESAAVTCPENAASKYAAHAGKARMLYWVSRSPVGGG